MPLITLKKFNEQFSDEQPRSVSSILEDAKRRKFSFLFPVYSPADYSTVANAVEKALPFLMEIAEEPNSVLSSELTIMRTERADSLSPRGVQMTMRDMRLWKVENGRLRPKFVYANERGEDTDTYENRMVKALIDRITRVLYLPANHARGGVRTVYGSYFQTGAVSKYDLVRIMDKRLFGARTKSSYADYKRILGLRRRAARLRASEFYRRLANCRPFRDRMPRPTNLIVHDKRYRACAELWKALNDFEVSATGMSPEQRSNAYSAFISLLLINAYTKLGFTPASDAELGAVDGAFSLKNFVLESELFKVTLSAEAGKLHLLVQCPAAKAQQRYSIGLYTDSAEMFAPSGDDQMTFSLYRVGYSERALCVTPGNKSSQADLASFARLTVFSVKAAREIYDKVCPVCGSAEVEEKKLCYACPECSAVYTFIGSDTLWFNRFCTLDEGAEDAQ